MRTLLVLVAAAAACGAEWKAGVARAVITPREPIWMAGYAARTKPSEGVRQDLFVKALALEDAAGRTFVIVSADNIGWTSDMSAYVAARAGVPRERLVLSASHTHSGPVTGQLGRPGYAMDPAQSAVIGRYKQFMLDATVDVIARAKAAMSPATLAFGQGLAGFAVNRRRAANRSWPGPVDHDVPVLAVRAADGKTLRAVVAGYACHATVLADYQINGDWPGYFKETFEKDHPGVEALYVAGCGADSNPLPRRSIELARTYGQVLAAAVDEVVRGRMTPLAGPIEALLEPVTLPFAPLTRQQLEADAKGKNAARQRSAARMLEILNSGGKLPESYAYPVQVWNWGGRLTWIVLASEVVVDYSLRLKAQYGWANTWVSAYANDYCGYIPSLRVLKEGGYEGGDAMTSQGHPGPWGERVEDLIAGKVADLATRAAKTTPK